MDHVDWRNLLLGILRQAIDDYIKLQHPITRRKKYLQEAYLTAIAFLFDNDYELANVFDGYNNTMSVEAMVKEILESEKVNLEQMKEYAIKETIQYWTEKDMQIFDHIPESINICGKVYEVLHEDVKFTDNSLPPVDTEEKIIRINKDGKRAEVQLLEAVFVALCLELDVGMTNIELKELAKYFHLLLKMNNCFTAVIKESQKYES
jgi:hypothetical protein